MIKALKANYIITSKSRILQDSSVIIEEDKIKDIVPNKLVSKNKYKTINLKNAILMPGFINCHTHLELNWTQKLIEPFSTFPLWLKQIIELKRRKITKKVLVNSVIDSINESINSGVTTIGEISSYDGVDFKPLKKSGLRVVYFYEFTNSTYGNLNKKFFTELLEESKNDMFELRIFPHSLYSLDTNKIKKLLRLAYEKKLRVAIHLSESIDEVSLTKGKSNGFNEIIFPMIKNKPKIEIINSTPLKLLDEINIEDLDIALVHMNNLNKGDRKILNKKQYSVIICPRSNMFLNQKLPDLDYLLRKKEVGIGTDGLSSNFSLDFLEELKFLYLSSKNIIKKNLEENIINKATIDGAKALGIEDKVGSIEKGKKADLIAFEIRNSNPYLSIINSNKKDLMMTMVNGKIIKLR